MFRSLFIFLLVIAAFFAGKIFASEMPMPVAQSQPLEIQASAFEKLPTSELMALLRKVTAQEKTPETMRLMAALINHIKARIAQQRNA